MNTKKLISYSTIDLALALAILLGVLVSLTQWSLSESLPGKGSTVTASELGTRSSTQVSHHS